MRLILDRDSQQIAIVISDGRGNISDSVLELVSDVNARIESFVIDSREAFDCHQSSLGELSLLTGGFA